MNEVDWMSEFSGELNSSLLQVSVHWEHDDLEQFDAEMISMDEK